MLFRCPMCKTHVCGYCHGTSDEDLPPLFFRLCDDCWSVHMKRAKRRGSFFAHAAVALMLVIACYKPLPHEGNIMCNGNGECWLPDGGDFGR